MVFRNILKMVTKNNKQIVKINVTNMKEIENKLEQIRLKNLKHSFQIHLILKKK
jgi:hypothetical protein